MSFVIAIISGCSDTYIDKVRLQVPNGTTRDMAIALLSDRAWYHQSCPNENSIDDLFFYDDQRYDTNDVIIVTSIIRNGVYIVGLVSTFDEPSAWHAAYRDCVDINRFNRLR
jgi:hypothetical protein